MPIPLEESGEPKDVVPVISKLDTASVELVLADVLSTISREGIRYVGLLATDVRDRIFLAHEIREHCSNAVLFTFSSDVLYLHPDANLDLRGMLVVTPYPLFSLNQLWSYPFGGDRGRLQFPNHSSQGVYNATLALLGRSGEMLEYGPPFENNLPSTRETRPALWVTVVGRDHLWPVRLLRSSGQDDYVYPVVIPTSLAGSKFLFSEETGSELELIAILLVTLICCIPSLWILRQFPLFRPFSLARLKNQASVPTSRIARHFSDLVFRSQRDEYRVYLLAGMASLFALYLVIVTAVLMMDLSVASINSRTTGTSGEGIPPQSWFLAYAVHLGWGQSASRFLVMLLVRLALLAALVMIAGSCLALIRVLVVRATVGWKKGRAEGFRLSRFRISSASSVVILLLGVFLTLVFSSHLSYSWVRISLVDPVAGLSTYLRSSDILSGLCPLLPLLFIGMAGSLWAMCCARRLRISEAMECSKPILNFTSSSFSGIMEQEDRVRWHINSSAFTLPGSLLLILLLGFPCYRLFRVRLVHTVEGQAYDALFGVVFFVVYLALSLSFLRFLCVWRELHLLLRRLSWHPLRNAYPGFRQRFPSLSKIEMTGAPPGLALLEIAVDQAGGLLRISQELAANSPDRVASSTLQHWLVTSIKETEQQVRRSEEGLAEALRAEALGRWRQAIRLRRSVQHALISLTELLNKALEPYWRLTASSDSHKLGMKPQESEWRSLAEDFLVCRVVYFLCQVFAQLQNLLYFVMVGLLLMLLSVIVYPFQPRDLLLLYNWSIILVFVGLSLIAFIQMDRDAVLSILSGTTPGQISWNWEFIFRIITYVFLPISALLGAQFPEVLRQAMSWMGSLQGAHM